MESFVSDIVTVETHQTLVLSGYPETGESEWHVNKSIQLGTPGDVTKAIVLQAADASQHWILITLDQKKSGWTLDTLCSFEGEKPASLSAKEHSNNINPDSIEVVEIQAA